MHTVANIFFIGVGLFAFAVIVVAIRQAMQNNRQKGFHHGGFVSRNPARADDIPAILHPGYDMRPPHPFGLVGGDMEPEVTSPEKELYMTQRMGEIARTAGYSTDRHELVEAGIRLGCTNECAGHYADMILSNDVGEALPNAMIRRPNIGSDDLPYAGPNLVEAEAIADEMKSIQHFGTEPTPPAPWPAGPEDDR